jgi:hypothetical protein
MSSSSRHSEQSAPVLFLNIANEKLNLVNSLDGRLTIAARSN